LKRNYKAALSAQAERRIVLSEETIVVTARAEERRRSDRTTMDVEILVRTTKTRAKWAVWVWHIVMPDGLPTKQKKQKLQISADSALERFVDALADALEENSEFKPKLVHYLVFEDPHAIYQCGYLQLTLLNALLDAVKHLKCWIQKDADKAGVPISKVAEALRSGASSVSIAKLATEKVA